MSGLSGVLTIISGNMRRWCKSTFISQSVAVDNMPFPSWLPVPVSPFLIKLMNTIFILFCVEILAWSRCLVSSSRTWSCRQWYLPSDRAVLHADRMCSRLHVFHTVCILDPPCSTCGDSLVLEGHHIRTSGETWSCDLPSSRCCPMSTSFAMHLPILSRLPAWPSQLLSPFSALLLSDLFLNKVPSLLHWCFSPHCPCDATKTKSSLCCCSYDILVTESWLSCIHCFFYIPLFVPRFQHLSHTHRYCLSASSLSMPG